jgi:3-(3-hydroxy-phenyl)propionate hydroxylase
MGGVISQLDVHYPLGEGHPAIGRRMADLDIKSPTGQTTVFELLHTVRPVLLDFTGGPDLRAAVEGWTDRVDLVEAERQDDHWAFPVIGDVPAPSAVLIRPDGHIAWTGPVDPAGSPLPHSATTALRAALSRWFGPAGDH